MENQEDELIEAEEGGMMKEEAVSQSIIVDSLRS